MKLGELAARLGCKLEGGENDEVHGVAGIEDARAGEVTFLSNPKYSRALATTLASGVCSRTTSDKRFGPAARRSTTSSSEIRIVTDAPCGS